MSNTAVDENESFDPDQITLAESNGTYTRSKN